MVGDGEREGQREYQVFSIREWLGSRPRKMSEWFIKDLLMIQWLRPHPQGWETQSSSTGQGTRSHVPRLKILHPHTLQLKILHAAKSNIIYDIYEINVLFIY